MIRSSVEVLSFLLPFTFLVRSLLGGPPILKVLSLKRILNELAPRMEKFSYKLWFIASMAVMMPINAMIPNAIIDTVMPVLNLFERTVRQDNMMMSDNFMTASTTKISLAES